MKRNKHKNINKMKKFEISIVIPTYNRAALLDCTLSSVKNQNLSPEHYEVIVVDDGSSDHTAEIVEQYKGSMNLTYLFQEDLGYRAASARNLGIRNAAGKIILFIDSGLILHPECVKAHLDSHRENARKVGVIGYVLGIEEIFDPEEILLKQIDLYQPEVTIDTLLKRGEYLDIREQVYQSCNDRIADLRAPWAVFWTGNVSIDKEEIERAGLFDTNYDRRWGVEDLDLGYRLHENRIPFILNRKASSVHCPHYSNTQEKLEQEHENKRYFHHKFPAPETEAFLTCTGIELNDKLAAAPARITI
jgi:glycosyltransferase involved in cell wall biosynthesis